MSAYILFFLFLQQRYTEASVGEWSTSLLLLFLHYVNDKQHTHTHTEYIANHPSSNNTPLFWLESGDPSSLQH